MILDCIKSYKINNSAAQEWLINLLETVNLNDKKRVEVLWALLSLQKINPNKLINKKIMELTSFVSNKYNAEILLEKINIEVLVDIIEMINIEEHPIFFEVKSRIISFIEGNGIDCNTDSQLILLANRFGLIGQVQLDEYIVANLKDYSEIIFLNKDELDIQLNLIELSKNTRFLNPLDYKYLLSGLILAEAKNYNLYEIARILKIMRNLNYPSELLIDGLSFLAFQQKNNGSFGLINYQYSSKINNHNEEYHLPISGVILSELRYHL